MCNKSEETSVSLTPLGGDGRFEVRVGPATIVITELRIVPTEDTDRPHAMYGRGRSVLMLTDEQLIDVVRDWFKLTMNARVSVDTSQVNTYKPGQRVRLRYGGAVTLALNTLTVGPYVLHGDVMGVRRTWTRTGLHDRTQADGESPWDIVELIEDVAVNTTETVK